MVYKWIKFNLINASPSRCLLCSGRSEHQRQICHACQADLPRLETACRRCGAAVTALDEAICGQCLRRPPRFDRVRALWDYAPPIDHLITRLKFQQQWHIARALGELLGDFLLTGDNTDLPQAVLPMPLHPQRLRERGYNQALEIARHTARRLDLPLASTICKRSKATTAQSGLPSRARYRNVRGAFTIAATHDLQRVAIVDDVVTTGATVNELSRVLKRSGVEYVEIWALARASLKPLGEAD